MTTNIFDVSSKDAQAMPVMPVEPPDFPFARYEDYAAECDQRYAAFMRQTQGVAVWQRVRVGEVFRDGCRDMRQSLRWQLGGLTKSLDYATDAPTYLEPWYGIGTSASAFGGEYDWPEGQAPVVRPLYTSMSQMPPPQPRDFKDVPIMRYTLETIEYFMQETQGRLPVSWSDIQSPLNATGELINTSEYFLAFHERAAEIQAWLAAMTEVVIHFTEKQSALLGRCLARPGHGFASSRAGAGIGMSVDNLVMVSPRMYEKFCIENDARIGARFGGTAIHSCGNWRKWLPSVQKISNLLMVDGAFSPQTDPDPNEPEAFRDALVNTGVVLHARLVGDPEHVLAQVKRLWSPGLKLIVVTYVQDPQAQRQLYHDIHRICA